MFLKNLVQSVGFSFSPGALLNDEFEYREIMTSSSRVGVSRALQPSCKQWKARSKMRLTTTSTTNLAWDRVATPPCTLMESSVLDSSPTSIGLSRGLHHCVTLQFSLACFLGLWQVVHLGLGLERVCRSFSSCSESVPMLPAAAAAPSASLSASDSLASTHRLPHHAVPGYRCNERCCPWGRSGCWDRQCQVQPNQRIRRQPCWRVAVLTWRFQSSKLEVPKF